MTELVWGIMAARWVIVLAVFVVVLKLGLLISISTRSMDTYVVPTKDPGRAKPTILTRDEIKRIEEKVLQESENSHRVEEKQSEK